MMADASPEHLDAIVSELDRRDVADRAERAKVEALQSAKDAAYEAKSADYNARVDAGDDPETAYADVFGGDEGKLRQASAVSSLRSNGYSGHGFRELAQDAFNQHLDESYADAESETGGVLVNAAGRARGIDGKSLFGGQESVARKYASRELLDYWQTHGRVTVDDFKAGLLGGKARSSETGYWS